jgi:membrane-associated phospholipid phosphatase
MSLLKWLDHIDKVLFVLIQHDADHSLLDKIMPVLRDPQTWIPMYAIILYYSIRKGKNRAWMFIILSLFCFAITDSVCAQLLKPLFGRLRPCDDPDLHGLLKSLVDCGGIYSLPSNHAANHFGLATFWYFAIRTVTGQKWRWLWVWAAFIGYAQVYVGVHYPFDVLAGSIFGYVTGLGMSRIFTYWWNREGKGDSREYGLSLSPFKNADRSL